MLSQSPVKECWTNINCQILLRGQGRGEAHWAWPHGGHGSWRQEISEPGREVTGKNDASMRGGPERLGAAAGRGLRSWLLGTWVDVNDSGGKAAGMDGAEEACPAPPQ